LHDSLALTDTKLRAYEERTFTFWHVLLSFFFVAKTLNSLGYSQLWLLEKEQNN
jgi:hypothetical protein